MWFATWQTWIMGQINEDVTLSCFIHQYAVESTFFICCFACLYHLVQQQLLVAATQDVCCEAAP